MECESEQGSGFDHSQVQDQCSAKFTGSESICNGSWSRAASCLKIYQYIYSKYISQMTACFQNCCKFRLIFYLESGSIVKNIKDRNHVWSCVTLPFSLFHHCQTSTTWSEIFRTTILPESVLIYISAKTLQMVLKNKLRKKLHLGVN